MCLAVDLADMIAALSIVECLHGAAGKEMLSDGRTTCQYAVYACIDRCDFRRRDVTFYGIDRCDHCGEVLAEGRQLAGLCESCERAVKAAKRVPDRQGQG